MHEVVALQLVRRGVQATRQNDPSEQIKEILRDIQRRLSSPGSVVLLFGTLVAFIFILTAWEYAIRFVVGNLACIESTQAGSEPSQKFEMDGLLETAEVDDKGGDVVVIENVKSVPITKKLRTTIRHLMKIGGFRSLFRGFSAFLLYALAVVVLNVVFIMALEPVPFGEAIGDLATILLVSPLHCSWTHAVIRAPRTAKQSVQTKTGWSRFIPGVWSKQLILPTIRLMFASTVAIYLSFGLMGLCRRFLDKHAIAIPVLISGLVVLIFGMFFLIIPAMIVLVRVEASLLPDLDETIVPCSRISEDWIVSTKGQTARAVLVRAFQQVFGWKLFDKESFLRVLVIYVKFIGVYLILYFLCAFALIAEIGAILGDETGLFLVTLQAWIQNT
jgi:hypothetical protein